jgi:hypothetical protein
MSKEIKEKKKKKDRQKSHHSDHGSNEEQIWRGKKSSIFPLSCDPFFARSRYSSPAFLSLFSSPPRQRRGGRLLDLFGGTALTAL